MNTDTIALLDKHFDLAVNAPDGIKRLREMILTLAMQGKLVPQDPKDQPASELLKEIEAEKKRLVKEGKIKEPKPLPPIKPEEVPYEVPESWVFCVLGNVALLITKGSTPTSYGFSFLDSGIPFIKVENVKNGSIQFTDKMQFISDEAHTFQKRSQLEKDDLLFSIAGTIGETCIVKESDVPANINQALAIIRGYNTAFLPDFLIKCLNSSVARKVKERARGGAMYNISLGDINEMMLPLPPLVEQRRIVAKIDELMARVDELERKRGARKEKRLAMHQAAIARLLDAEDATASRSGRDFIFAHFADLYGTKQNVAELRKAILQLAVMGRLVPQDPKDQPASELLKEIEAEKKRLVQEGKIKEPKLLPPIKPEEVPYQVPKGWEWVRLGDISDFFNGDRSKNYPNREEYVEFGIPWINTGHIEPDGSLSQSEMNFISREKFDSLSGGRIQKGDLVYCLRGATLGKVAFVEPYKEGAIASSLMIIRTVSLLYLRYVYQYLIGPLGRSQIFRFDNGSAQPNLSANNVQLYVFPLPPLAEQHRIVTKVDELMALCDKIDKQIDERTEKESALLEAVAARV